MTKTLETYRKAFSTNYQAAMRYTSYAVSPNRHIVLDMSDLNFAQRQVDNDSTNPDLLFTLGKVQLGLGYWDDAIATFRRYLLSATNPPTELEDFVDELENIVQQK